MPEVTEQDRAFLREATQKNKVYWYLLNFGSITPLQAMADLGCMRLAARIDELKSQGVNITSSMQTVKNRWGQDCRVARYTLSKEK